MRNPLVALLLGTVLVLLPCAAAEPNESGCEANLHQVTCTIEPVPRPSVEECSSDDCLYYVDATCERWTVTAYGLEATAITYSSQECPFLPG